MHAQAAVLLVAAGLASAAYAPQNVACPGEGLLRLSGTPAQGGTSASLLNEADGGLTTFLQAIKL